MSYIETDKPWIEDGIVHVVFKKGTVLSIDLAKKVVQERIKMSNGKDYPLYVDIRGVLSVDAKTRNYLSGEEGVKNALCAAVHVDNPMSKFFANLFIAVNKPIKPTKLFTDKEKAMKWLKKISK